MKGIILLNGEPYEGDMDFGDSLVYCCDGAYNWAKGRVRIDKNIGDFDSLDCIPNPPPEEIYPSEKNFTDGEIALNKMLKEGVEKIEIYGGGGRRDDHFLGNLQLIYRAHLAGVACELITNYTSIFVQTGRISLGGYMGKTFSVFPFGGKLHIMDFGGVKYSYPEYISLGECRGISNVVESPSAYLEVDGVALLIVVRGEK